MFFAPLRKVAEAALSKAIPWVVDVRELKASTALSPFEVPVHKRPAFLFWLNAIKVWSAAGLFSKSLLALLLILHSLWLLTHMGCLSFSFWKRISSFWLLFRHCHHHPLRPPLGQGWALLLKPQPWLFPLPTALFEAPWNPLAWHWRMWNWQSLRQNYLRLHLPCCSLSCSSSPDSLA